MSPDEQRFKFLTPEEFEALPTVDEKIAYIKKATDAAARMRSRGLFREADQPAADDHPERKPD